GWNKRNKDSINIGKKNNSEFVIIPTARLKDRIAQLCEQYGIQFIETEESYTSKASFLDGDYLPTYGEKPKVASSEVSSEACDDRNDWKPSGKRIKRGLYRTTNNWYINADCNGAANIILKQVSITSSSLRNISLERVSRALLTAPHRIKLWSANKIKTWKNSDDRQF
ncbi:MAG: hypothetical protein RLZZ574_2495, partial [Cyanobacteriota bacterium]